MPSKSKEQHNFMAAVANNASFAKKAGVPKSVGQEFMQADKGIKFKGGQQSRPDLQKANKPKTNHGKLTLFNKGGDTMASKMNPKIMAMMAARKKPMMQAGTSQPGTPAMMKKGGRVKKMADGGDTNGGAYTGFRLNMPSNTRMGKLNARDTKEFNKAENSEYGKELSKAKEAGIIPRMTKDAKAGYGKDMMPGSEYKKGGKVKKMAMGGMAKDDRAQDKKMVKKAVGMHDKQMHGGKKTDLATLRKGGMAMKKMAHGGLAAGHKAADGVATKGKTKGAMIKMSKGGRYC